ncbi:hypothetical protein [Streptomyces sp. GbtcB6]|uniref:hypothetical protein n=1 Tax=Streptomyces sp. GbtcB6 TaxID=2824751 RepID=UPI001C2F2242|nr:hypothetical protein [Streptomyces sp. GbtcB6]
MIRIVTAARLRRMSESTEQASARVREIQGQADAANSRHVREAWNLLARAESAESDAAILREIILHLEDALEAARADASEQGDQARALRKELDVQQSGALVLLLHYGEPHSIHANHADAHAYTATHGVPVDTWGPRSERPAADVNWVSVPFIRDEAVKGFRSVEVRSPESWEGAA